MAKKKKKAIWTHLYCLSFGSYPFLYIGNLKTKEKKDAERKRKKKLAMCGKEQTGKMLATKPR